MKYGVIELSRQRSRKLHRRAAKTRDAALRTRYMILVHSARGLGRAAVAERLGCSEATVRRARQRYQSAGESGLYDRREDNGDRKVDDDYIEALRQVLQSRAREYGHRRPTWTLRLLIETLGELTGVLISRSTMSRLLRALGARRGRPKPTVGCPWPKRRRMRRIRRIHRLIDTLPSDEAAVWEDEVDLDLNPRIGADWMLPGMQREVVTPGKNVKYYLAGAMDALTGKMMWVKGPRKNTDLFIAMLRTLQHCYRDKRVIHVIVDNYVIHSSRRLQAWLSDFGDRIRLHFLPPYCPDDNRIERCVWRELHANVTYNHACMTIDELVREAILFLMRMNRSRRPAGAGS